MCTEIRRQLCKPIQVIDEWIENWTFTKTETENYEQKMTNRLQQPIKQMVCFKNLKLNESQQNGQINATSVIARKSLFLTSRRIEERPETKDVFPLDSPNVLEVRNLPHVCPLKLHLNINLCFLESSNITPVQVWIIFKLNKNMRLM